MLETVQEIKISENTNNEELSEELFKKGKFLYINGNDEEAMDILNQCLKMKIELYGETDLKCAEAYYYSGKTLAAIAKKQLDEMMDPKKMQQYLIDALVKGLKGEENEEDNDIIEKEGDMIEQNGENQIVKPQIGKNSKKKREEDLEEGEIEEDDDFFELAFENLDVARIIYEKSGDLLKSAEVRMVLGDSLLDAENVEEAIEEYTAALEVREKLIPGDRLVADCHFVMGLAYQVGDSSEDALNHFNSAKDIFKGLMEKNKDNQEMFQDFSEIYDEISLKITEEMNHNSFKEININEEKEQVDND